MTPTAGTSDGHHTIPVKIYYEDTDSLGVVYYANYLKYMERGRTELIDGRGERTVADWNRDGFNFAVYQANMKFLKPARLGDRCEVWTAVRRQSEYRLVLDQEVRRNDTVLVKAEVHLVCLDANLELREMPEGIF